MDTKPVKEKINPSRLIANNFWGDDCSTYLLYAETEGGDLKFLGDFSIEKFIELKKIGYFDYREGDGTKRVYPSFAELAIGISGHDFRIDELNGDRPERPFTRRVEFYPRKGKMFYPNEK